MKIINIEFNDKKDKFEIKTDNSEKFLLSYDNYENFNIENDMIIDDELHKILLSTSKFEEAFEISLNFLSYKLRTEKEIVNKLKSKNFDNQIIEEVIERMKKLDLIDDFNYAKVFINDKINLTNYSKKRIINDLYLKGIDKKIYENYLNEHLDFDFELEKAEQIVSTKINLWKQKYQGYLLKNKIINFLLQKGFDYNISKIVSDKF